jgi:hypothetical protein
MMNARSHHPWRTTATLLLLTFGITLLPGCGNSDEKFEAVPVSGKVTLNNVAVPMGRVLFHPDKEKGNTFGKIPSGEIGGDGSYTLTTPIVGAIKDGAPAGWYKVTIEQVGMSDPNQAKIKMPRLDNKFSTPKDTPLQVEVKAGAPAGAYDLKLKQ